MFAHQSSNSHISKIVHGMMEEDKIAPVIKIKKLSSWMDDQDIEKANRIRSDEFEVLSELSSTGSNTNIRPRTPKSPKLLRRGSSVGLASMDETKVFLNEAHENLKSISPRKLRNLRFGEELRDLIGRVKDEMEMNADRIDANSDSTTVSKALAKLRISVSKAQPLLAW